LAFDTSAAHCAAALLLGDQIVACRVDEMAKGQGEHLFSLLGDMLDAGSIDWSDLTAIGVGTGPGNFTGIRISVSAARGLALSLGISAVGVDGFQARSFKAPRPACVLIPAPREQVYRQDFTLDGTSTPRVQPRSDAESELARLSIPVLPEPEMAEQITNIARIAAITPKNTGKRPTPLYVKPADATPSKVAPPVMLP
jgi:tRNA threonylcarbamoyl adenosine modification protein YeaZ